jgi:hypothetical protein
MKDPVSGFTEEISEIVVSLLVCDHRSGIAGGWEDERDVRNGLPSG